MTISFQPLKVIQKNTAPRARRLTLPCSSMDWPPNASKVSQSMLLIGFSQLKKRKFIVADTPGHEQYTRNMATGASTAELAVVMIDARQGVLTQTRRHSYIASLLGIRHIVVAVNKMDLVDYSENTFREIEAAYRAFAEPLGFSSITIMPLSALEGDNMSPKARTRPGMTAPRFSLILKPSMSAMIRTQSHFGCRYSGKPPQSRFSRFLRYGCEWQGQARRRDRRSAISKALYS